MAEVKVTDYRQSMEVTLDAWLSRAKGIAKNHFRENAKGSIGLRQRHEGLLNRKMEEKGNSLRGDWNRFYESWTRALRVGEEERIDI